MAKAEEKDFDPSRYAAARLFWHTTMKGTQVGAVFGCGVLLPVLAFRGYRGGKALDINRAAQALTYSTAGGLVLSNGMCLAKYMGMDKEGLEDRVYRLHYNTSQTRCDAFSAAFGVVAAVAVPFFLPRTFFTIAGAFTFGSAVGTLAHVVTSKETPTDVGKMVHEAKTA